MLIDARHTEETRVAVVKGNRIEEFDFEAAAKKQIKGNIYLAKVTRVEPSLQAAFIEYGGNRHGFLAFSEIHPDYYQIPKEDRDALLREEQRLVEGNGHHDDEHHDGDSDDQGEHDENGDVAPTPEEHGGHDDAGAEALRRRRMALRRRYKIQEVIRRRQVMLVQVVKEERGNKGAALTTYISLAGRYSVLMPNTAHGGGISRKIASVADRKRLKTIIAELDLPPSMGAIVRTAGLERTKTEIKRDFDYLTRLWDEIRERTLGSAAPALIHEDSDLVKRAIRDIYNKDIDEVLVDGAEGYKAARTFMKLLMPSHAKKVKLYADPVPLFHRAGVEGQLAAMMNPVVQLRSGGYIVINPTEALVAVDVNSGRSTREYNIEETALKTNIEAAEEVARQLRLRDMAGLVVIDFIDMDHHSNNRKVERALKDALKNDRARIQVGRISAFGLMEMSRQRLRTGVLEASTHSCPMCDGTGLVRSPSSAALLALRMLEEEIVKGRATHFRLRADRPVAIYILNRKREEIVELESRYGITIEVVPDESLIGSRMVVDSSGPPPAQAPRSDRLPAPVGIVEDDEDDVPEEGDEDEGEERDDSEREERRRDDRDDRRGGRRRRRRGGRDRDAPRPAEEEGQEAPASDDGESDAAERPADEEGMADREPRRRRRRRRRGGRREDGEAAPMDGADGDGTDEGMEDAAEAVAAVAVVEPMPVTVDEVAAEPAEKPKRRRTRKAKADDLPPAEAAAPAVEAEATVPEVVAPEAVAEEAVAKPKRSRARKPKVETAEPAEPAMAEAEPVAAEMAAVAEPVAADVAVAEPPAPEPQPEGPPRRGWWQRTFGN
ncbi:Rne/Rng family ribonuclease [Sandaracinobacteroides saxicola]|uniref:Ribonuclease E n=2 Tax=Sandaracinobacteroides saxicola TaxID=2759707 RepID=A0A7G5IMW8_9SPHN|nr:Rne/Rng family ribonuclease [Sandaracinobacteroides saxicola]